MIIIFIPKDIWIKGRSYQQKTLRTGLERPNRFGNVIVSDHFPHIELVLIYEPSSLYVKIDFIIVCEWIHLLRNFAVIKNMLVVLELQRHLKILGI